MKRAGRRSGVLAIALLVAACTIRREPAAEATSPASARPPAAAEAAARPGSGPAGRRGAVDPSAKQAPATAAREAPAGGGEKGALPASDRVFTLDLGGRGHHVLGADGDRIWLAEPPGPTGVRLRWKRRGPGVAHRVVHGDYGRGPRFYVAWGVGRGHLDAPLVLEEVDPATGAAKELWRRAGERNECAHLSIADADGDGAPELVFAYYASKYFVKPRIFEANGRAIEGPEVRMATSRAYADLDGDGRVDEIIGRVYCDARGQPGDLRVRMGKGTVPVPTENGVRALLVAAIGGESRPSLYFADGWVADYGKSARAQLKRARWAGERFVVETLGRSPDEFTFFDLTAFDLDGDGQREIVARGNEHVTVFSPGPDGWRARRVADLPPVLNTAVGRDAAGRPVLFVPARPATRVVALEGRR